MHTTDGAVLRAVLFDRDGTLVHDVPYNGDPVLVRLVDGAEQALARLRAAGLRTGIVTNQSGIGRGLITREQAEAVTAEVVRRVGGVDVVRLCEHAPDDGCRCRKPAPGMIESALAELGLHPSEVAVVGDSPGDAAAAAAAGCRAVLVPQDAPDLLAALDRLLPVVAAR
ncbi:D-glycero-alpha-D-manno-heptose-1,7-bisphosphate 7-phosphatase [Kineococcus gynurae]|uniref:D,D-heptose 1,7-bisphosphate phosphatase n=1 Tax=Kineococcus gynurae TaxID=452979 RepID=A0ABV5LMW9_9ACTN